jgi:cytochrome c-type biogenesis protein
VGPVLTGILLLATNKGSIPLAVVYLVFYSAGLGLPFLLASFFFNSFVKVSVKLRTRLPLIQRISGVLLIVIGILIAKGDYKTFNIMASNWQSKLSGKTPYAESTVYDTDRNEFIQPEEETEKTIIINEN